MNTLHDDLLLIRVRGVYSLGGRLDPHPPPLPLEQEGLNVAVYIKRSTNFSHTKYY